MKKIIVVGGPTSTGKTNFALKVAKEFDGELVNADSRQIYKYLNVGTNKEGITESNNVNIVENIPIYLVNIITPDQRFSVYQYQQLAFKAIDDIWERDKLPILVGGTGLYIDAVLKNYNLKTSVNAIDSSREELESKTVSELQNILKENNIQILNNLNNSDKNNSRRLIRLIEKLGDPYLKISILEPKYDSLFLYPEYHWDELKIKIENRVEQMFKEGLVEETKHILDLGYQKEDPGLQIMGYKQVIEALEGKYDFKKCIELVKLAHKQYARRQRTWFEGEGRDYKLTKISNKLGLKNVIEAFL